MAPLNDCHELVTEMQTDPFTACTKLYRQLCRLERANTKDNNKDAAMVALEQSLPKYQDALQTAMGSCFEGDSCSDGILAVTMLTQAVLAARVAKHAAQQHANGDDRKSNSGGPAARRQQQSTVARTLARLVNAMHKFSSKSSSSSQQNDKQENDNAIITTGVVPRAFLTSVGVLMDLGSAAMCPWRNQVEKLVPVLEQFIFSSDDWISGRAVKSLVQLTWLALPLQQKNQDDGKKQVEAVPFMEQLILTNLREVEKLVVGAVDKKQPVVNWDSRAVRRIELVSTLLAQGSCPAVRNGNQWSTYALPTDSVLRIPGRCFDLTSRVARLLVLPAASLAEKERLVKVGQAVLNLFSSAVKCTGRGGALAVADTLHTIIKDLLMVPADVMRIPEWTNAIVTVCTITPSFFLDRAMFKLALRACTTHIENVSLLDEESSVSNISNTMLTYTNACTVVANVMQVGGVRIHPDEYKNLLTAMAKMVWTENKISHVCCKENATFATLNLLEALCGAGSTRAPLQLGGRHVVFALLDRLSQNAPATSMSNKTNDVRSRTAQVWKTWSVHLSAGHTQSKSGVSVEIPGAEEFTFVGGSSNITTTGVKRSIEEQVVKEVKKVKVDETKKVEDVAEVSKDVEMKETPKKQKEIVKEKVVVEEKENEEDDDEQEQDEEEEEAIKNSLMGSKKDDEAEGKVRDDEVMSDIPDLDSDGE